MHVPSPPTPGCESPHQENHSTELEQASLQFPALLPYVRNNTAHQTRSVNSADPQNDKSRLAAALCLVRHAPSRRQVRGACSAGSMPAMQAKHRCHAPCTMRRMPSSTLTGGVQPNTRRVWLTKQGTDPNFTKNRGLSPNFSRNDRSTTHAPDPPRPYPTPSTQCNESNPLTQARPASAHRSWPKARGWTYQCPEPAPGR